MICQGRLCNRIAGRPRVIGEPSLIAYSILKPLVGISFLVGIIKNNFEGVMIGSTALAHGFTLVTANTRHFEQVFAAIPARL